MVTEVANMTRMLSIAQAARESGVHVNTVRRWIDTGRLDAIQTFYGRAIPRESFEELMRQRRAAINNEALSR